MQRFWSFVFSLLLLNSVVAVAYDDGVEDEALKATRQNYLRAEHALRKNDQASFNRLAPTLTAYPLYPYLVYERLKQQISNTSQAQKLAKSIVEFETTYPDFPYLKSLRRIWLYKLGKQKQWTTYAQYYQPLQDAALACYAIQANYQLKNQDEMLKEVLPLWHVGYSQPNECDPVFTLAQQKGIIGNEEIIQRHQLTLLEKNFDLSKHLSKKLTKETQHAAQTWMKLVKDPYLIFNEKSLHTLPKDKHSIEILTHAVQMIGKREPEKALKWWQKEKTNFPFTAKQKAQIERDIGVYLSHQRSPKAKTWLNQLTDEAMDNTAKEWRIRLALLEKDWPNVLKWIGHLDKDKQNEKEWQYWFARAHSELKHPEKAKSIYESLSKERNYYGFLASLHLNQPISLKHHPYNLTQTMYDKVRNRPAIQRFYELIALNKEATARVEWFRAIDKMNEEEIIAAAKIAQKMKLHDVAIFTMSKAQFKDDVNLRFPLAFYNEITQRANEYNLDPAWVFAIARQESAFHNEAISHRGAVGLLQLLPDTAKYLAKKHDIHYPSDKSLIDPDKNIQLGSVYLKELKQRMKNNTIVATASYNAGPTKTQTWLPKSTQEAEIWIEAIPYRETREYVKNVLAFTSIYRMQLGFPSSFAMVMKPVEG